ncbi:MAG: FecR family protein, partial [Opitutaceae bacterium]
MSRPAESRVSAGSGDDARQALVRTAAEWHTRIDAGLTAGEQEQFERWLEADARHPEVFGEMNATWALLDHGAALSPGQMGVTATGRALTLVDGVTASERRPARGRMIRRFALPLAAAACIAIGAVALFRAPSEPVTFAEVAASGEGVFKRVNLPDGSVARLNASTGIAVDFRRRERHVRLLRGEAHFTVARDAARPFVVEASGLAVRAVGTAFTVSTRAGAVEVLVTEGKV